MNSINAETPSISSSLNPNLISQQFISLSQVESTSPTSSTQSTSSVPSDVSLPSSSILSPSSEDTRLPVGLGRGGSNNSALQTGIPSINSDYNADGSGSRATGAEERMEEVHNLNHHLNSSDPSRCLNSSINSSQSSESESGTCSEQPGCRSSGTTRRTGSSSTPSPSKLIATSDHPEVSPVSEEDWVKWIRGEPLGNSSEGIESIEGVESSAAGEFSREVQKIGISSVVEKGS